jgi:hypothetical protein
METNDYDTLLESLYGDDKQAFHRIMETVDGTALGKLRDVCRPTISRDSSCTLTGLEAGNILTRIESFEMFRKVVDEERITSAKMAQMLRDAIGDEEFFKHFPQFK